jgi:hypothetical protein
MVLIAAFKPVIKWQAWGKKLVENSPCYYICIMRKNFIFAFNDEG